MSFYFFSLFIFCKGTFMNLFDRENYQEKSQNLNISTNIEIITQLVPSLYKIQQLKLLLPLITQPFV